MIPSNSQEKKSGEFDLIARYFQYWPKFSKTDCRVLVENGDDCLVIKNHSPLAISVDTIVEQVHFLSSSPAFGVGYRALATAVSDLVAMGATPSFFTLALSFNKNEKWLSEFSSGLKQAAQDFQIDLQGGDTTHLKNRSQATVITVSVHGLCENPIKRSNAKVGDLICVSGSLGDAAAAVSLLEKNHPDPHEQFLLDAFYQPKPPVHLINELANKANSAIDISDGLLADLMHICKQSQVSAKLDTQKIPLSHSIKSIVTFDQALTYALTGGDDYQVCFTIGAKHNQWVHEQNCFIIGEIINVNKETNSPDILDEHNHSFTQMFSSFGYQHF